MKFIHTADWQLGLPLRFLRPERAAELRLIRYQTVRRIADLALQHRVDAVIVAGDVLDDNGLGRDALQQASDALRTFGTIPVFLLPGNHDAATEDSALRRLDLPSNVHLLDKREPSQINMATLYPAPLQRRHEMDDPTEWLPERQPGDTIRIAVAHGGVLSFTETTETPNKIDAPRVLDRGFDYLALGDWHGLLSFGPRVWYSGAHEPTRFKESKPGYVLLVEIDAPGAEPRVTPIEVAQTRWLTVDRELTADEQVDELRAELDALPEKALTLLKLTLHGALSMAARDALDRLVSDYESRLVHLEADLSGLQTQPTEADLAALGAEGFMAAAAHRMRTEPDAANDDALRLMFRLQNEGATA